MKESIFKDNALWISDSVMDMRENVNLNYVGLKKTHPLFVESLNLPEVM